MIQVSNNRESLLVTYAVWNLAAFSIFHFYLQRIWSPVSLQKNRKTTLQKNKCVCVCVYVIGVSPVISDMKFV